jgi:hypothetical protein
MDLSTCAARAAVQPSGDMLPSCHNVKKVDEFC